MAAKIHELRQQRATLARQANEALDAAARAAAEEGRSLTDEELRAQDAFDAQLQALDQQIKLEERKLDRERLYGSAVPRSEDAPTVPSQVTVGATRADRDPARGFANHREFLTAVLSNTGYRDVAQIPDERLRPLAVVDKEDKAAGGEMAFMLPTAFTPHSLLATAGSDEQGGYDDRYGGFARTSTLLPGLLQVGTEADPTTGRTQPVPMATPMVDMLARVDKNHASSVSGGFVVTRKPETLAAQSSRVELERVTLRATSLFGLAFTTEEILQDSAVSFVAIIEAGFRDQFAAHLLMEKLRGGGGNEFLGVLNSPAAIEVPKEPGQAADTIVAQNVINMRARCWNYSNAIWIANHDTYPQLITMAVVVGDAYGAGGIVMVYKTSSQEDRPDTLLGRPIFYSEYASKLGDVGDIILCDWSQYLEGLYQPIQSAESVHVRFVHHERAFKFWLRNAGAPWWRSPLTPNKSTQQLSPIVTLQAR